MPDDDSHQFGLKQYLVHRLDRIQYRCLVKIAGAYKNAPYQIIHKELCIDPIAIHLHQVAMAHRARLFETREAQDLEEVRKTMYPRKLTPKFLNSHPYHTVFTAAKQLRDEALEQAGPGCKNPHKAINSYVAEQAALKSTQMWNRYRRDQRKEAARKSKELPVALEDDWGPSNLKRYKDLSRAQSTIIMNLRIGFDGLNSFPYKKKVCLCPVLPFQLLQ